MQSSPVVHTDGRAAPVAPGHQATLNSERLVVVLGWREEAAGAGVWKNGFWEERARTRRRQAGRGRRRRRWGWREGGRKGDGERGWWWLKNLVCVCNICPNAAEGRGIALFVHMTAKEVFQPALIKLSRPNQCLVRLRKSILPLTFSIL